MRKEPGGVGHLVGLEAGLLNVKQRSCQTQSHSFIGIIASVLPMMTRFNRTHAAQSPSLEAKSSSVSPEISHIL
jgi:hypothetical protein